MSKFDVDKGKGSGAHRALFGGEKESPYPTRKNKWEDRYERKTFYVEKRTFAELEKRAGGEKGEKTRIINQALQQYMQFYPDGEE